MTVFWMEIIVRAIKVCRHYAVSHIFHILDIGSINMTGLFDSIRRLISPDPREVRTFSAVRLASPIVPIESVRVLRSPGAGLLTPLHTTTTKGCQEMATGDPKAEERSEQGHSKSRAPAEEG